MSRVVPAGPVPAALHRRVDGDAGRPALLLVNSLGTDLTMWDGQVARWTATHRVVRYDQRGHGASATPPGPWTIDDLGRDALAVLDDTGVDRADVCGLSLGGVVALWLAANAPDRVRRVVLADTAARVGTEQAWRDRATTVREHGLASIVDLVLERFFSADFLAGGAPAVDRIAEGLRRGDDEGYAASCEVLATADLRRHAARVHAPSLVVVGTADAATPPEDARALRDLLPAADYRELPGAGHLANLEQPDEFAAIVADFLTDQEPERA
jgi:3-oxoadipate enol-lactonase